MSLEVLGKIVMTLVGTDESYFEPLKWILVK